MSAGKVVTVVRSTTAAALLDAEFVRAAGAGTWLRRPAAKGFSGVGTDSRGALDGHVFVALRGERHDGHEHVAAAANAGASAALVDRDVDVAALPAGFGVLRVDDALAALQRIAAAHRRRLRATVVGITGSAGKTTTRRMLDAILSRRLRGVQSPKSFNNHIGVPLTLLSADASHDYVLAEIGMSAPGEIASLARIAEPEIGIVTSIGRAHLAGLGSVEAIAREKASLLANLRAYGAAIACADAPALRPFLRGLGDVTTFGESPDADVRLTARGAVDGGQAIEVDGSFAAHLALPGRHNAINALAAIAAARRLGVDDGAIAEGLARTTAGDMRFEPRLLASRDGEAPIMLVNDAYNANPDSVAAALATFVEIAAAAPRRVIVLGDMLELGDDGPSLHAGMGERVVDAARRASIDVAIFVGPLSAHAARVAAREPSIHVIAQPTLDADAIATHIRPGDAVLLKASRGMALERAAEAITWHFGEMGRKPSANLEPPPTADGVPDS